MGLPVASSMTPVGLGLAEVQMKNASQSFATFWTADASVTSTTATDDSGMLEDSRRDFLDASVRTRPMGRNSSGRASSLRKRSCPVWPPAPVTMTFFGAAADDEERADDTVAMMRTIC